MKVNELKKLLEVCDDDQNITYLDHEYGEYWDMELDLIGFDNDGKSGRTIYNDKPLCRKCKMINIGRYEMCKEHDMRDVE